ncbi:unnamed protein product [Ophioblennius macclurei]
MDRDVEAVSDKFQRSLTVNQEDATETYQRFILDGKTAVRQGDFHKALDLFKLAFKIQQSPKLETRIQKIQELIDQNDTEEEDDEFVNVNDSGLMLFKELYNKLYDYQRDGVAFLYSLHRDGRSGGILADDMGLGKTIQVISFLSGMYDSELVKHVLLIMPTSLLTNWTKEFSKWTPGMRVKVFHGVSKAERNRDLEKVQRRGGVIITTYSMLMNNWQQLGSYQGGEFTWDYMVLDEAHKIKTTSTKTAKSAYAVQSKHRILLTGTPVQNNLKELWALFDFACQGTLLGTAKTFKTEYENPITRAREKDATAGEKALGALMSENLMTIIKPYFLRRTKSEVQKKLNTLSCQDKLSEDEVQSVPDSQTESGAVMPKLTRKNDLIVWTYLSSIQEEIYRQFISLDHIKELLLTTRSPLAELTILKKLCDHPRLLSAEAVAQLGLEESQQRNEPDVDAQGISGVPDSTLISESGKMVFLFALLKQLREEGHRTLVFAHYRKVLDIIERILGRRGFKVLRLDGTITQLAERERRISLFQSDTSYSVFLLTTQVGGVGITLTAANRVVIYDPSWNPATDAQAVDRAYRIGQTENVVIYRLITCGTVEEKIYRRQVFKDSLIRQNTGDKKNPFRYFSKQELKELFTLEDTQTSSTQLQLQALHSRHRRTDPRLDQHIAQLHTMQMFGISDHDLMFSLDTNHDEELEDQEEQHYIKRRVQQAQELMNAESEQQKHLADNMMSNTEAAWLRLQADVNSREKQSRQTRPSPPPPQQASSGGGSPLHQDLDSAGSGMEGSVIDLTEDSTTEVSHNQVVPSDLTASQEHSHLEATNMFHEDSRHQNSNLEGGRKSAGQEDSEKDLNPPLLNHRLSVIHTSRSILAGDVSSTVSIQSYSSNFNLQLEDSNMSSGQDGPEAETEEQMLELEDSNVSFGQNGPETKEQMLQLEDSNVCSGQDGPEIKEQMLQLEDSNMFSGQDGPEAETEEQMLELEDSNVSFGQNGPETKEQMLQLEDSNVCSGQDGPEIKEQMLQLEDSNMFSGQDGPETETEEQRLLSQLQIKGSFDVSQLLSEKLHMELDQTSLENGHTHNTESSVDGSIVAVNKRRARVIYDSEEDDPDDLVLHSFSHVLQASTPKSGTSSGPESRRRRSIGEGVSVASRQSLLQSIIQDMEEEEEEEE